MSKWGLFSRKHLEDLSQLHGLYVPHKITIQSLMLCHPYNPYNLFYTKPTNFPKFRFPLVSMGPSPCAPFEPPLYAI